MPILLTGGAGYIGSHVCVELLTAGYEVVILDNFSNSSAKVLQRIETITGKSFQFYQIDLLDEQSLEKIFIENSIEAVIHLAGFKAVGESVTEPLMYYQNNLIGTITLCKVMQEYQVKRMIFSSSATVYDGATHHPPYTEGMPLRANSPYGHTKQMIEQILQDLVISDPEWNIAILRYFNPVGAHESGQIGEHPAEIPNNLMPYITQVAIGKLSELKVFGQDYPTKDGTAARDYIHVVDLALGHLQVLEKKASSSGITIYNLGTGRAHTVLELIHTFEKVSGQKVPYQITERRPGDLSICYASVRKVEKELGWMAKRDIIQMCQDAWNWQYKNPNGYSTGLNNRLITR